MPKMTVAKDHKLANSYFSHILLYIATCWLYQSLDLMTDLNTSDDIITTLPEEGAAERFAVTVAGIVALAETLAAAKSE